MYALHAVHPPGQAIYRYTCMYYIFKKFPLYSHECHVWFLYPFCILMKWIACMWQTFVNITQMNRTCFLQHSTTLSDVISFSESPWRDQPHSLRNEVICSPTKRTKLDQNLRLWHKWHHPGGMTWAQHAIEQMQVIFDPQHNGFHEEPHEMDRHRVHFRSWESDPGDLSCGRPLRRSHRVLRPKRSHAPGWGLAEWGSAAEIELLIAKRFIWWTPLFSSLTIKLRSFNWVWKLNDYKGLRLVMGTAFWLFI